MSKADEALEALLTADEPMTASEIATLCPAIRDSLEACWVLQHLEQKELIARKGTKTADRGKPRVCYVITPKGRNKIRGQDSDSSTTRTEALPKPVTPPPEAAAAPQEVADEIDWNHPLIAAGEKKLAELNAAAKLPAIGQMSDHTPPPPRSSLTELAEPPVTAVTPQTPQIAVDATLELSIEQTGRLHVGPHTFTAAETTLLGRFLLATRGVWLNLNTRDQHAE